MEENTIADDIVFKDFLSAYPIDIQADIMSKNPGLTKARVVDVFWAIASNDEDMFPLWVLENRVAMWTEMGSAWVLEHADVLRSFCWGSGSFDYVVRVIKNSENKR